MWLRAGSYVLVELGMGQVHTVKHGTNTGPRVHTSMGSDKLWKTGERFNVHARKRYMNMCEIYRYNMIWPTDKENSKNLGYSYIMNKTLI